MKLQHLAIGDRFEYEGKIFVKTGPLTATAEQGGQQMIPRYAVLKPLDKTVSESKPATRGKLTEGAVVAAFDAFYRTCTRLSPPDNHAELEAARQQFLSTLK